MRVLESIVNWAKDQFAEIDEAVKKHRNKKSNTDSDSIKSRVEDIQHTYENKKSKAKENVKEFTDNVKTEAGQVSQEVKEKAQEKKESAEKDDSVKTSVENIRKIKDKANVKTEEVLDSLTEDSNTKNNLSHFEATNTSGNTIVIEAENEAKVAQICLDKGHARKKSSLTINKLED